MGCSRSKFERSYDDTDELEGDPQTIEVYDCLCCEDPDLRRKAVELVAHSWCNAQRHILEMDMHTLRGALSAAQDSHGVQISRLEQFLRDTEQNAIVSFLSKVNSECTPEDISISFEKFNEQWAVLSDADKRVTHSQLQILRLCSEGLEKSAYTRGVSAPEYTPSRA